MAKTLTFQVDGNLAKEIRAYAKEMGFNQSQAIRDLIRLALGESPQKRGFDEGFVAAVGAVRAKLSEASGAVDDLVEER